MQHRGCGGAQVAKRSVDLGVIVDDHPKVGGYQATRGRPRIQAPRVSCATSVAHACKRETADLRASPTEATIHEGSPTTWRMVVVG